MEQTPELKQEHKFCPACNEKKPVNKFQSLRCISCTQKKKMVYCRVCTEPILKISSKDTNTHRECRKLRVGLCPWNLFVKENYQTMEGSIKERMAKLGEIWKSKLQEKQSHVKSDQSQVKLEQ